MAGVVPFYMGFLDELPHVWEPYKAARAALANTTSPNEIKRLYAEHSQQLGSVCVGARTTLPTN